MTEEKTCKKCGYSRQPEDDAPDYECPKCGVIYAKVDELLQRQEHLQSTGARQATAPKPPPPDPGSPATDSARADPGGRAASTPSADIGPIYRRDTSPMWPRYVAIGAVCIIAGYFLGRYHMQYEIASAMQSATAGIAESLGQLGEGAAKPEEPAESAPAETSEPESPVANEPATAPAPAADSPPPSPVSVDLVDKGFREADYTGGRGGDAITFVFNLNNTGDRDIRAFQGVVAFLDPLDNVVYSVRLTVSDPLSAGASTEWSGGVDFNQFIDGHQALRRERQANLGVRFEPEKIRYANGDVQEF